MEKIKRTPNTILDIGCRGKGEGDKKGTVVSEALMEVVEKPLAKILTEMEKTGALLDVGYLKKIIGRKTQRIERTGEKNMETGRRGFQHQFTQANGRGFVCEARAGRSEAEKDGHRSLLHQCLPAYQTERNSSDNRRAYGISRNFKIGFHLH